jgi:N6-adenosine-specific RNA methylase IME4
MRFGCVYADPPWKLSGGKNGKGGWSKSVSPDVHYPLMELEEIMELPVDELALSDAHLWLWVPNPLLPQGLMVMNAWGFKYMNNVAWRKLGALGLGQYVRTTHELCLFGKRGNTPYARHPDGRRNQIRSCFEADKGAHSEKPAVMRSMIQQVSPGPYVELFSRHAVPGWERWGNDRVGCTIQMPYEGTEACLIGPI